jgi:hypothetical protein
MSQEWNPEAIYRGQLKSSVKFAFDIMAQHRLTGKIPGIGEVKGVMSFDIATDTILAYGNDFIAILSKSVDIKE